MKPLRCVSVAEARAIDERAVREFGMPTLLLMENAGAAVAAQARELGARFLVLCGAGNNGGDGLVAARHLGRERCTVLLLQEPSPGRSPDAALQLRILRRAGWQILSEWPDEASLADAVVIDALFGTGLSRPLDGPAREWIERANRLPGKKLAVDIPSGLHGDTGKVLGCALCADRTVTFEAAKLGMTVGAGPQLCGEVVVAPLGLPG